MPVFFVLFLIYISKIFDEVIKNCPMVTSLLFIYDLIFVALGGLVKKVEEFLKI